MNPYMLLSCFCKFVVLAIQTVEIPSLKETRKVKSMQMFHKPVGKAKQVRRKCLKSWSPQKEKK